MLSQAELSLLMMNEEAEDRKHFNYNDLIQPDGEKKKKKKKGKNSIVHMPEQDFQVRGVICESGSIALFVTTIMIVQL